MLLINGRMVDLLLIHSCGANGVCAHEAYWGFQEVGVICERLLGLSPVVGDFVCPVNGDLVALDRDLFFAVDNADFVVSWILAN